MNILNIHENTTLRANKYEDRRITVLVIEPGKEPYTKNISPKLKSLQAEVGGLIQVIYPFDDSVALICNEEAKLLNMPLNRALYDQYENIYDIIAGAFILTGLSSDSFSSLTKEQIEKYRNRFISPEHFVLLDGKINALPIKNSFK